MTIAPLPTGDGVSGNPLSATSVLLDVRPEPTTLEA